MDAHRTAAEVESLSGGLLMALMIAGERGRMGAEDRLAQRQEIVAHNAQVARARAARRHRAAVVAKQVAVGQSRLGRWIDRTAH